MARLGKVRQGLVRHGMAWRGAAWQGAAGHGMDRNRGFGSGSLGVAVQG